ncbi:ribonuclease HII [Aquisalinus flavus]|uniref:Ribonuclease HII n=1 Tax=Aquisalinus flavus TaxID=1526572 RepID=A0A8J2V0W0_9PROT|nr:ribonuclease HII [Aquisalinus flavus]GGC95595.1 ribonuclease HII [Aquisalinus flavus]
MAAREPKIRPTFDIERKLPGLVCGIDEAGRGPWAGPVVAAAVILNPDCTPAGICDSKMLSPARRAELAHALWKTARIGVGIATVEEIDRINIAQATMLAMARAAATLPVPATTAIVDGNMKPKLSCPAYTVIKGDARSLSIAAASIIAKVTRDRMMLELARAYPWYGWESNKGYCAPVHRAGLERHGVTPHHRRSFAPIRAALGEALDAALPLSA